RSAIPPAPKVAKASENFASIHGGDRCTDSPRVLLKGEFCAQVNAPGTARSRNQPKIRVTQREIRVIEMRRVGGAEPISPELQIEPSRRGKPGVVFLGVHMINSKIYHNNVYNINGYTRIAHIQFFLPLLLVTIIP
ncbi:MAG: hypothetical protein ACRD4O_01270, partial [Bryobacteraceae bacterium]